MKISEVIKQLEELKEKHGDMDVVVTEPDYGNHIVTNVCLSDYWIINKGTYPAILIA